jgi:ankyrin repeat protein
MKFKVVLIFVVLCFTGIFNACAKTNQMYGMNGEKLVWQRSLSDLYPDRRSRALAKSAGKGDVEQVNKLIQSGLDPNVRGASGVTPALWPLLKWNYEGFKALIDAGTDVNVVYDDDHGSLLGFSALHEDSRFLKLLLDNGADANQRSGTFNKTPLFRTLDDHEAEKRKYLYAAGADINATADSYLSHSIQGDVTSPLLSAFRQGHYVTALELLRRGANPYLKMDDGRYHMKALISHGERMLRLGTKKRREFEEVKKWLVVNAPDLNIEE